MSLDVNTKKLKKNAFRVSKERGIGASRIRVPGGYLKAEILDLSSLRSAIMEPSMVI